MTNLAYAPHLRVAMDAFAEEHGTSGIRYEIVLCDGCGGSGTETLRGCVFTAEDMAEDPDFAEDYASGFYSTACTECGGYGRYYVLSEYAASPEAHAFYGEWLQDIYDDLAVRRAESGYAW